MFTCKPQKLLVVGAVCVLFALETTHPTWASPGDLLEYEELEAAPKIGRATAATLLQGNIQLLAPEVQQQVQQLADELAMAADLRLRLRVHILNSSLANLVSLPSGDIFVFTGFLDMIANRDELAFGLAHEIAHLRLDHGLNQMKEAIDLQRSGALISALLVNMVASAAGGAVGAAMQAVPVGPFLPLFAQGVIAPVSEIAARLAALAPEALVAYIMTTSLGAYSRAQEEEADRLGLVIMNNAHYNPAAAITLMEKLSDAWHTK